MAMSDRLKSIAEITGPVDSPNTPLTSSQRRMLDAIRSTQETDSPSKRLEDFKRLRDMFDSAKEGSVTTTEKQVTMSDPDMFDELYQLYENEVRKGYRGSFNDFLIDRREADVDVPVAGEFEDMLMKMYNEAVDQGYKGTFFDFLIDRMDPEFDPAESIRVSRLPEGIMQLMNMMQNRRT